MAEPRTLYNPATGEELTVTAPSEVQRLIAEGYSTEPVEIKPAKKSAKKDKDDGSTDSESADGGDHQPADSGDSK